MMTKMVLITKGYTIPCVLLLSLLTTTFPAVVGVIYRVPRSGCQAGGTPMEEQTGNVGSRQRCILRCVVTTSGPCSRANYYPRTGQCILFSNSTSNSTNSTLPATNRNCTSYVMRRTCLDGFTYLPAINTCIRVLNAQVTWSKGQSMCNALHPSSHLVTVNSTLEHGTIAEFVNNRIRPNFPGCFLSGDSLLWTAGQRIDPTRQTRFVWKPYPNGVQWELSAETNGLWYPGEPSFGGSTESCLHVWKKNLFNDVICTYACCPVCQTRPDFDSA